MIAELASRLPSGLNASAVTGSGTRYASGGSGCGSFGMIAINGSLEPSPASSRAPVAIHFLTIAISSLVSGSASLGIEPSSIMATSVEPSLSPAAKATPDSPPFMMPANDSMLNRPLAVRASWQARQRFAKMGATLCENETSLSTVIKAASEAFSF
jgi:hypothetical protein